MPRASSRRVSQTRHNLRSRTTRNKSPMTPKPVPSKAPSPSTRRKRPPPGVSRQDSDDELGNDDIPWEWIYSDQVPERNGDAPQSDRKRRKLTGNNIVGARIGKFECRIGDAVLLKADGSNEAWVALICDFVEDDGEGEKAANFMWFSTEKEIRNREKKRTDFVWVCRLQNHHF